MDDLMEMFSANLVAQYNKVLDDIRNDRPDFYNSYNELIELLLKSLVEGDFKGSVHTLINNPAIREKLNNDIKMDKASLKRINDLCSKASRQKHSQDRSLSIDIVLNYMSAYYNFLFPIVRYYKYAISYYDEQYFKSIYGSAIKQNNTENGANNEEKQLDIIGEDINELHHKFIKKTNSNILKKLVNSPKEINSFLSNNKFKKYKKYLMISSLGLMILSIIYLIFSFIKKEVGYNFSFIIPLCYFIWFTYKIFKQNKSMSIDSYKNTFIKINVNEHNIPVSEGRVKFLPLCMYYLFNILLFLQIVMFFVMSKDKTSPIAILMIIFATFTLIASIILKHYYKKFLTTYSVISFKFKDATVYYDGYIQKYVKMQKNGEIK